METEHCCCLRKESCEWWLWVSAFVVAIINFLQKYLAYLKHPKYWKSALPENLPSALGVDLG